MRAAFVCVLSHIVCHHMFLRHTGQSRCKHAFMRVGMAMGSALAVVFNGVYFDNRDLVRVRAYIVFATVVC